MRIRAKLCKLFGIKQKNSRFREFTTIPYIYDTMSNKTFSLNKTSEIKVINKVDPLFTNKRSEEYITKKLREENYLISAMNNCKSLGKQADKEGNLVELCITNDNVNDFINNVTKSDCKQKEYLLKILNKWMVKNHNGTKNQVFLPKVSGK